MTHRATKEHQPDNTAPLVVRRGDRLRYERRPTEWKGWVWCISTSGRSGWAPESWLALEKEVCVALRDYDSTELVLRVGEEVRVDFIESGWAWVESDGSRRGWVPLACLKKA